MESKQMHDTRDHTSRIDGSKTESRKSTRNHTKTHTSSTFSAAPVPQRKTSDVRRVMRCKKTLRCQLRRATGGCSCSQGGSAESNRIGLKIFQGRRGERQMEARRNVGKKRASGARAAAQKLRFKHTSSAIHRQYKYAIPCRVPGSTSVKTSYAGYLFIVELLCLGVMFGAHPAEPPAQISPVGCGTVREFRAHILWFRAEGVADLCMTGTNTPPHTCMLTRA